MDELLDRLNARIIEIDTDEEHFFGGCAEQDGNLLIILPQRLAAMEKELSARGLLAHRFDVEITDWPMAVAFADLEEAA
ncbi:hypothetical protein ACIQWN_28855 [Streptomyces vinaceus]|uniref:hypothetical protein n=1 Tax=Streptomyces vinaceus TaxID=1960 RepID=UPI0037F8DD60